MIQQVEEHLFLNHRCIASHYMFCSSQLKLQRFIIIKLSIPLNILLKHWEIRSDNYIYMQVVCYTVSRKSSLIYITSHQNLSHINISNCPKLHIFARFGLLNKIEIFSPSYISYYMHQI